MGEDGDEDGDEETRTRTAGEETGTATGREGDDAAAKEDRRSALARSP
jgi:hypothetical protein